MKSHTQDQNKIIIFTDGASSGNPGPGGWGAVLLIPEDQGSILPSSNKNSGIGAEKAMESQVIELGGYEKETTNNRMELTAAAEAVSFVKTFLKKHDVSGSTSEIIIYTDSRYLINGITKWLTGWIENGWRTKAKKDVINRDLWESLAELVECFDQKIRWEYVKGHVGVHGNERADQIATSGGSSTDAAYSGGRGDKKPLLYRGPAAEYPYPLIFSVSGMAPADARDSSENTLSDKARSAKKRRSRATAYSYVSLVDGTIMTHTTWSECEARVKGKSGAKYKKALDSEEEKRIMREWTAHL